jgi:fatty acid synthase
MLSNIAGIKDASTVSQTASLADLGMDSIMGAEIKQTLERGYDVVLSAQDIRGLNFVKLTALQNPSSETSAPTSSTPMPSVPASPAKAITNGTSNHINHTTNENGQVKLLISFFVFLISDNYDYFRFSSTLNK